MTNTMSQREGILATTDDKVCHHFGCSYELESTVVFSQALKK